MSKKKHVEIYDLSVDIYVWYLVSFICYYRTRNTIFLLVHHLNHRHRQHSNHSLSHHLHDQYHCCCYCCYCCCHSTTDDCALLDSRKGEAVNCVRSLLNPQLVFQHRRQLFLIAVTAAVALAVGLLVDDMWTEVFLIVLWCH